MPDRRIDMKEIRVASIADTNKLAEKIAGLLNGDGVICMSGDLGAGKTTFTKALGKAIGITSVITSPTFQIMKIYEGKINLYHIDAYRLEGITQDLGFEEEIEDAGIKVIEWYDYIDYALPAQRLEINIRIEGDERVFELEAKGKKYEEIVEAL